MNLAWRFSGLVLGAGMLWVQALGAADVLFEDTFAGSIDAGWSWVREHRDSWRVTSRGLEVKVLPGNMWGPPNNATNVLTRGLPGEAGAALEVSVTISNQPTHQYEQANLVWYYDDSHMIKIGQELVDGKLSVVMGREAQDRTRTMAILTIEPGPVRVSFLARGSQVIGRFLPTGAADWRDAGQCDVPAPPGGQPKISLQCYQGDPAKPHWARFTDFQIRRIPAEARK